MSTTFGFDNYRDHDFFHARCGRGAIIIAVRRLGGEPFAQELDWVNSDKYVARVFHEIIGHNTRGTPPIFNPVLSIAEDGEFVRLTLRVEHKSTIPPVVVFPIDALIDRVIPAHSVTFETIRENHSQVLEAGHLHQ